MQMVDLSTCVLRVDLVSTGTVMMLAVRKCGLLEYKYKYRYSEGGLSTDTVRRV